MATWGGTMATGLQLKTPDHILTTARSSLMCNTLDMDLKAKLWFGQRCLIICAFLLVLRREHRCDITSLAERPDGLVPSHSAPPRRSPWRPAAAATPRKAPAPVP